jgi:coenzyme F420-dependent glucose-6-phosphate dehydrogenase
VDIYMAAGGPKSSALAAQKADGIITSVKDPAVTIERVIAPSRAAAAAAGKEAPSILATRWSIFARDPEDAWTALRSWRGLRAPGRLEAVDPAVLRERADDLPRSEVLDKYSIVTDPDEIVATYLPLVQEIGADIVTLQMSSTDQPALIDLLGSEVLPPLRAAAEDTAAAG